jgi:hypothetical protein
VTNSLSRVAIQKFFSNNGAPAAGFKLFTYEAGTSNKLATYQDETTGAPNTNPIIMDFRGECRLWTPPNVAYKYVFSPPNDTDPPTNPIWSVNNVLDSQLITLYGGVDTGIVNAYVLNFVANFTAYTDGIVIYWIPSNTNTGASTINVNGLGPVAITNQDGSALSAGQLIANQIAQIMFKGTGFIVLNAPQSNGSFAVTLSGVSSGGTGTLNYELRGSLVLLQARANILGVSNTNFCGISSIPAFLSPAQDVVIPCVIADSSNNRFSGAASIGAGATAINLLISTDGGVAGNNFFSSTAFNAGGGNKGVPVGWTIVYSTG